MVVNTTDGAVKRQTTFDAFGRITASSGPLPAAVPFGFAGGLHRPELQLVRFGARDYDPEIGRWTSKDPIRFDGGDTNIYAYVGNDPVNRIDPTGLEPEDQGDGSSGDDLSCNGGPQPKTCPTDEECDDGGKQCDNSCDRPSAASGCSQCCQRMVASCKRCERFAFNECD